MSKAVAALAPLRTRLVDALARLWALAARAFAVPDLRDWLVFGGIGLAAYGAGQVYAPAGWIVAGVALFYIGARR